MYGILRAYRESSRNYGHAADAKFGDTYDSYEAKMEAEHGRMVIPAYHLCKYI
jgi:hypothetical protein